MYSGDVGEEEMVTFVQDFIVQNTIQKLDFERKYEGWGSMMWVLAVVGILLVCFIILLFYIANLKGKSKKVKVLIFGLGLLFIITPLISGAIAMMANVCSCAANRDCSFFAHYDLWYCPLHKG